MTQDRRTHLGPADLRPTIVDHESSAASDDSESSASSCSTDADPPSDASDSEDDVVAAPSAVADETAKQVPSVLVEVQEQGELQDQLREAAVGNGASSSFFAKEVGFCESDLAKTGRSKCRHCGNFIGRGEPRFAYHFSRTRPSVWMHGTCVASFVQAGPPDRKSQAVRNLQSVAFHSGTPPEVANAARLVLLQLEQT